MHKRQMHLFLLVVFAVFGFSVKSFAFDGYTNLYGLRDSDKLHEIIKKLENSNDDKNPATDTIKKLGIAYHNLAVINEKGASEKAWNYLERTKHLMPDDYEVLAYYGNIKAIMARESWNIFKKIGEVKKALILIDTAVKMKPDSIPIRMVRALNGLEVPGFMKRKEISKNDFHHIEKLLEQPINKGYLYIRPEVLYKLGMLYREDGDDREANRYFKEVIIAYNKSGVGKQWKQMAEKELYYGFLEKYNKKLQIGNGRGKGP